MHSMLFRVIAILSVLALSGCNLCNITQAGSQRWAFDGVVSRVFTPGDLVPLSSSFRYEVEFDFEQPDSEPAGDAARYIYRSATLKLSNDDTQVAQIGDSGGSIELKNTEGADRFLATSTDSSTLSGTLGSGVAATRLRISLDSTHETVVEGPLSSQINDVLPAWLDLEDFNGGTMTAEFGSGKSFVEGEIRSFHCL